jgi:protein-tyrosine phosphatase
MDSLSDPRRRPAIGGESNFRDLGGYRADNGRRVRWGAVYRSGGLARLTDEGVDDLARLGLKLVCDFRAADERKVHPSRLPAGNPPAVDRLPIRPKEGAQMRDLVLSGKATPDDVAAAYRAIYRAYVLDHAVQYAALFKHLADGASYPLVFHCAAGKDRTGVAAALILTALGVPWETVLADYLLTNEYFSYRPRRGNGGDVLDSVPEELRATFVAARQDYLETAFAAANEVYGSLDAYLRDALSVSDAVRDGLRSHLLE